MQPRGQPAEDTIDDEVIRTPKLRKTTLRTFLHNVQGMQWKDFLISALWFYLNCLFMTYMMNLVHERMPDANLHPALPDTIHDLIPFSQHNALYPRLQSFSNSAFAALVLAVIAAGFYTYKFNTFTIGCRLMSAWGTILNFRVWFMLATPIPPTEDLKCRFGTKPAIESWTYNAIIGVLSFGASNVHCGDLIFSGHTVFMSLVWLACVTHLRHLRVLCVLATISCFGNMFLIVVLRNHYTIDVLCAFYVSATVWYFTPLDRSPFLTVQFWTGLLSKCIKCCTQPQQDPQIV